MKSLLTDSSASLIIQEHTCCQIGDFRVGILSHLGQFADIHYFQVTIYDFETEATEVNLGRLGLLRIGSVDGGLSRELQLRQSLGDYKMISELLAAVTEESVSISFTPRLPEKAQEELTYCEQLDENVTDIHQLEQESEYLEEEFYPEEEVFSELSIRKLILLSDLPNAHDTLETWIKSSNTLDSFLLLASQVCQFFRHLYQQQWCVVQILPQFIQMGTPIKFFDLTGVYPVGDRLTSGFMGDYCAPEIAYDRSCTINEQMSTYTVGALLYQAIHQKLPAQSHGLELEIKRIPPIYQILKLCLSPIPEERFSLSQLLSLLVESRKSMLTPRIQWDVYGLSTVGLSTSRLQNEDSYGVRQYYSSNSEPIVLGVVADGMGGMAQGEVASRLAVQTVLEAQVPSNLTNQQRADWLAALVQDANACVTNNVRDGGTTLSVVLAIAQDLMVAHVGDSRIYLLRKKQICQLSEDHSMVAMLVANGQMTYEESQVHPDRNVLIRSLGSKRRLSDRYVQDLSLFGPSLSMSLEDGDTLLLCSDGVWDLVSANELAEIFAGDRTLRSAVELTLEQVLTRGASDNATVLALKCCIENSH